MDGLAQLSFPTSEDRTPGISLSNSIFIQNVWTRKQASAERDRLVVCEKERISSEVLEERWKEYFRDPSQWVDKRTSKTSPRAPDFQHKTSDAPLWIYSWFNPPWIKKELRKRGLQVLPSFQDGKDGDFSVKQSTTAEDPQQRHLFTYQKEEVEDGVASYDALLKLCAMEKDLERGTRLHVEIVQKGLLEHDTFVGSSLINMYAKCGALSSAKDVFDKLPVRNEVSWNALIGGYTHQGHGEEAILMFEQMQGNGFSPDNVTFACILKACGTTGMADKGMQIHSQIARYESCSTDIVVGTALVDMYGRLGMLIKAQEVFDGLPFRNVVSWNVLIARYSDHECHNEALRCFFQMLQVGISPTALTFLSTLKACGSMEVLDLGREVHGRLIKEGFPETDSLVGTPLVDMYVKCGDFEKAEQIFHGLNVQNVVPWNVLIAGYGQHGLDEKAFKYFKDMQLMGLSPDAVTFLCVLKSCGNMEELQKGQEVHDIIARDGLLEKDTSVMCALVDMYAKCGALEEAKEVSFELPKRNVIVWTVLIAGYVNHEHAQQALECYDQMLHEGFSPDIVTFPCVLKACTMTSSLDKGREVHTHIMKDNTLATDPVIGTALIDMYARCGSLEMAQQVFNKLPECRLASWNALIAGYVQHAQNEDALSCFEQMQLEGFIPDRITYLSVLKACGSLGAVHEGHAIHVQCVKDGLLDDDTLLGTAVIDMYGRCRMLEDAQDAFEELPAYDVVAWNALITGYSQHAEEEALRCFEQMQLMGFPPDLVTFISFFRACSTLGTIDKGLEGHRQVVTMGLLEDDMAVNNILVDMYANFGMLTDAHRVFEMLPARDVVLWNALISGYAQAGNDDIAFSLFDQMKGEGHIEQAVAIIHRTEYFEDATIWHTVLAACRWQNSELVRWVSEQTVQMDEKNPGSYVAMSNVIASIGKGKGVKFQDLESEIFSDYFW